MQHIMHLIGGIYVPVAAGVREQSSTKHKTFIFETNCTRTLQPLTIVANPDIKFKNHLQITASQVIHLF
jgi:hypothetical protein